MANGVGCGDGVACGVATGGGCVGSLEGDDDGFCGCADGLACLGGTDLGVEGCCPTGCCPGVLYAPTRASPSHNPIFSKALNDWWSARDGLFKRCITSFAVLNFDLETRGLGSLASSGQVF